MGNTQGQLLIVADGIGDRHGGYASSIAIDVVSNYLLNTLTFNHDDGRRQNECLLEDLKNALWECRSRLQDEAVGSRDSQALGSTITLAYITWPQLRVLHVGDSRCYLFRDFRLQQLTTDHTFAQKMVDRGVLAADRAANSRWNNILWNVVGAGCDDLEPETCSTELALGDALLLCTDGLTKHISDHQIGRILAENRSAQATCQLLVDAAKSSGGSDNITVVVARFRGFEESDFPSAISIDTTEHAMTRVNATIRHREPASSHPTRQTGEAGKRGQADSC